MNDKELIKALRDYAQACVSDKHYDFNPGLALIIANRMEQLTALAENGQSAIDTNRRLTECFVELQPQLDEAIKVLCDFNDNFKWCGENDIKNQ